MRFSHYFVQKARLTGGPRHRWLVQLFFYTTARYQECATNRVLKYALPFEYPLRTFIVTS